MASLWSAAVFSVVMAVFYYDLLTTILTIISTSKFEMLALAILLEHSHGWDFFPPGCLGAPPGGQGVSVSS